MGWRGIYPHLLSEQVMDLTTFVLKILMKQFVLIVELSG